jgi:hypothetical protein
LRCKSGFQGSHTALYGHFCCQSLVSDTIQENYKSYVDVALTIP